MPCIEFNSKYQKTLDDIFALSPKIKFTTLIKFFKYVLNAEIVTSSGSGRKFETRNGDYLAATHERHGRDRKDYTDVNFLKSVKAMLMQLNITSETYEALMQEKNQPDNTRRP